MKKKRVFILIPSLGVGGAERVLVNLLKKIDLGRFDVTLCLLANFGTYFNEIPEKIELISVIRSNFMARCLTYLQLHFGIVWPVRRYMQAAVKGHYHVGISFSDGTLTDNMLFIADRFDKKIAWVHSCYKSQRLFTPARIKFLKTARYDKLDHIVFVSKNSEAEFSELFGNEVGHSIIYNLFDGDTVERKSLEVPDVAFGGEVVNIVAIGRMVAVKQYDKLIKGVRILADKGLKFKLRFVGDGEQRENLQNLAKALSLERYIDFLGFKPNPYPYIKHSDILVISSQSEAFPTVMIEAMLLDTAVVATRCSGCTEISDGGKYALLADHSAESIAEKLETMITDSALRKSYTESAKRRILDYEEQTSLDKIYRLWET